MSAPRMFTAQDLARAVVLYHEPSRWTDEKQAEWNRITGQPEESSVALSTALVAMARQVLESEVRIDLGPVAQETTPC